MPRLHHSHQTGVSNVLVVVTGKLCLQLIKYTKVSIRKINNVSNVPVVTINTCSSSSRLKKSVVFCFDSSASQTTVLEVEDTSSNSSYFAGNKKNPFRCHTAILHRNEWWWDFLHFTVFASAYWSYNKISSRVDQCPRMRHIWTSCM